MSPYVPVLAFLAFLLTPASGSPHPLLSLLRYDGSEITIDPSDRQCQRTRECADCNTGIVCMQSGDKLLQFATVRCSADGKTPYCDPDSGLCSSVAPTSCTSDFVCPAEDGTYPDPASCSQYHICTNRFRVTNACPPNNVYDHKAGECRPRLHVRPPCKVVNCQGTDGQSFAHPVDDRIHGICVNGRPYILGRCKDYQRYDIQRESCVRACRDVGKQPHDTDCQKYVLCASVSLGQYKPVVQSCACNEGFDPTVNECTNSAPCLKNITPLCPSQGGNNKPSDNEIPGSGGGGNNDGKDDAGKETGGKETDGKETAGKDDNEKVVKNRLKRSADLATLIINNSGNGNSHNNVSNGDDNADGNVVNGNGNGENQGSGNVNAGGHRPPILPLIINNSGNNNDGNDVSNGNDDVDGNVVNGNGNGDNSNSGNVKQENEIPSLSPLIINNSGHNNSGNDVSNGNDDVDGNIVNGNGNGENSNSGNVNKQDNPPAFSPLIINNSGNKNNGNDVSNGNDDVDGNIVNGNGNGENSNSGNVNKQDNPPALNPLIINNSGNNNNGNDVSNGNDDVDGNIVNGNGNGENSNSGNVNKQDNPPALSPLIINNSGNNNNENDVSNGNDDVDGNIVNGNGNGENSNSGNVNKQDNPPALSPLIINNSGNNNNENDVSNGNDDVDGNIVNGNGNGENSNSGNVNQQEIPPALNPLIINNSGSNNNENDVSNGNDDVDGNIVNGNGNGENSNSGNVNQQEIPPALSPLIINNSGNNNNGNDVSNGNDDVNGNIVNGNGNGNNSNSGNVNEQIDAPALSPLIINNSGNGNKNNNVSNGDDKADGNVVNGNGNGENHDSGNVDVGVKPPVISPLIINNSGNNNKNNSVANGDDNVDGNTINGNGNGNNENSGNVNLPGKEGNGNNKPVDDGDNAEWIDPAHTERLIVTSTQPTKPDRKPNRIFGWIQDIIEWIKSLFRQRS